jgi:hypothetical protein
MIQIVKVIAKNDLTKTILIRTFRVPGAVIMLLTAVIFLVGIYLSAAVAEVGNYLR